MSDDFGFGYKTAWISVRGDDANRIASILKIKGAKAASWKDGIAKAYKDGGVFITKPINGWTYVIAIDLMSAAENQDTLSKTLKELSKAFGETQYFVSYRVVDAYGWVKASKGKIVRAYLNVEGSIHWDDGALTPAEKELGLDDPESFFPNEESVLKVAEAWSLNPSTLNKKAVTDPTGLVGKL